VVTGNIPIGAGLSSSAALELAVARALASAASLEWNASAMAKVAQRAENEYVGVSCGIMDQIAVAASKVGQALLLDCRSLDFSQVPIPDDAVVVVMDTGTRRALASEGYNQRRRSCEESVRKLQKIDPSVGALRDVSLELLAKAEKTMVLETYRRARHVIEENARTIEMAEALRSGDLERCGRLMNASHQSLRDLYEVSSPDLDLIAALARKHPACWGARMTGAGFGGCGVALVQAEQVQLFGGEVEKAYRAETGLPGSLYCCHPVDGTRLV
jgi:galactokinase